MVRPQHAAAIAHRSMATSDLLAKLVGAFAVCAAIFASSGCTSSLESKCNRGDGVACGVLGDRALHGADGATDFARVCDMYRKGCSAENFAACANLGALLGQRKCVGRVGEGLAVLRRACDHGATAACNNLGMLFRDGSDGAPRDIDRAITLFRAACPKAAIACDNLGALLIEKDERGATAAFQVGCDSSAMNEAQAGCCFKLGLSHENGWGTPVDIERARFLYNLSCARSVREGCYHLGLLELKGGKDGALRAAIPFRKACDAGVAPACNNLGLMYDLGNGLVRDRATGLAYLQRACDGGELRACANLGSRYFLGDGAPLDPPKGRALLAQACAGGITEGCVLPTPTKR
jgi:TPR repeat protein